MQVVRWGCVEPFDTVARIYVRAYLCEVERYSRSESNLLYSSSMTNVSIEICVFHNIEMSRVRLVLVFKFSHALEQEKFVGESCVDVLLQICTENSGIWSRSTSPSRNLKVCGKLEML
jgi:hypothetical protein